MARTENLTNFLTDVADSIRAKTGKTDTIAPADFDTEISSIETGGGGITPTGTITITENGTHDVTEYATAEVNVEGEGGAARQQVSLGVSSSTVPQLTYTYCDTEFKAGVMFYPQLSSSTPSATNYLWRKKTKNDIWPICFVKGSMTANANYRCMFYVWCTPGKTVNWASNNIYVNANVQTTHNLEPITEKPQLIDFTFTYTKSSSSYEPLVHIYPACSSLGSDTDVFVTPVFLWRTDYSSSTGYGTYPYPF